MNSQNGNVGGMGNPYCNPGVVPQFMMPHPHNMMFDQNNFANWRYNQQDQQAFEKWWRQMNQYLAPQFMEAPYHNQPFSMGDYLTTSNNMAPMYYSRNYPQSVRSVPGEIAPVMGATNIRPTQPVVRPQVTSTSENVQRSIFNPPHQFDPNMAPLITQKRKKEPLRQQKQKEIIVIDLEDDIPVLSTVQVTTSQKPSVEQQQVLNVQPLKLTRSREQLTSKKATVPSNPLQKRDSKSNSQKLSSEGKIEEDSFKPNNNRRNRKIKKTKTQKDKKRERERMRFREIQLEKSSREKRISHQQKMCQHRVFEYQGKIIVSSFHQAKDPEFRLNNQAYQREKQIKKQSLMSRLQFKGSVLQEEYKQLKEAQPQIESKDIIRLLRSKYGTSNLNNYKNVEPSANNLEPKNREDMPSKANSEPVTNKSEAGLTY